MVTRMKFRSAGAICFIVLWVGRGYAQIETLSQTRTPSGKFALGWDSNGERDGEQLWLVSLPKTHGEAKSAGTRAGEFSRISLPEEFGIGRPVHIGDFLGLPYHGGAVWNTKRQLVALTQAGIPHSLTKVFRYSKQGLEEVEFPEFRELPETWYRNGECTRTFIDAIRWIGKDTLLVRIAGTISWRHEDAKVYYEYEIDATVRYDKRNRPRIVHTRDTPLEEIWRSPGG